MDPCTGCGRPVGSTKAGGTTYVTVVNRGSSATTVNVNLAGVSAVGGGTVTVLTGDPTAVNSIQDPAAVAPVTRPFPHTGPGFRYTFPANSLTVLALRTS